MKKKIFAIIIACLVMLNCIPVYANSNTNIMVCDDSINEIKNIENDIVEYVNGSVISEGMGYVNIDDIDYEKAVRFYYAPILEYDKLTDEIMEKITITDNCDGFYYMPFYNNDKTAVATVQQNIPLIDEVKKNLTDEQIEEHDSKLWQWHTSSVGVYDYVFDYRGEVDNALKENNIKNAKVYYVAGISRTIISAAVICTDNPDDTKIKILNQFDHKAEGDGGSPLDRNELHTLDEIKEVIAKEKPLADGEMGAASQNTGLYNTENVLGNDNSLLIISIISGVAVVAAAVIIVCVIKKKKTKNIES